MHWNPVLCPVMHLAVSQKTAATAGWCKVPIGVKLGPGLFHGFSQKVVLTRHRVPCPCHFVLLRDSDSVNMQMTSTLGEALLSLYLETIISGCCALTSRKKSEEEGLISTSFQFFPDWASTCRSYWTQNGLTLKGPLGWPWRHNGCIFDNL